MTAPPLEKVYLRDPEMDGYEQELVTPCGENAMDPGFLEWTGQKLREDGFRIDGTINETYPYNMYVLR